MNLKYFIILLLTVFNVSLAVADKQLLDPRYEALKSQAFKLRNTDLEKKDKQAWRNVVNDLLQLAQQSSETVATVAYLQAGVLSYELFTTTNSRNDLINAKGAFELLISKYPKSALADDAWVRRGQILLEGFQDRAAAIESYQYVVRNLAKSDQLGYAISKLHELQDSTPRTSSNSVQVRNTSGLKVMIDPGHGGEDFGAEGLGGLLEKDVVLDLAFKLRNGLMNAGAQVELTRESDEFVPLAKRTAMANKWQADIFISLHTNASHNGNLSGMQTYYLDNSGDAATKLLAERENTSLNFEGSAADVQFMISDLIQGSKIKESRQLAHLIQNRLEKLRPPSKNKRKRDGVKSAPFYVLVGAHMPCVLVEVLFIDNQEDAEILAEQGQRQRLAQGIMEGILDFSKLRKVELD